MIALGIGSDCALYLRPRAAYQNQTYAQHVQQGDVMDDIGQVRMGDSVELRSWTGEDLTCGAQKTSDAHPRHSTVVYVQDRTGVVRGVENKQQPLTL